MKNNLLAATFAVAALGFACPAGAAVCAPANLVHIVVANVTPGIAADSFAAQPKVYYRIGNDRLRVEEALDSANGIHGVLVVSEPNIWLANLYDGTGKHIMDPGPSLNARAPVFGTPGLKGTLIHLEFGCETDFIAANAPKPVRTEKLGNDRFDVYRIEDGSEAAEILEVPGSARPVYARYYHQGSLVMTLHYDLYETGLPNDPQLFTPPANVKFVEASPPSR